MTRKYVWGEQLKHNLRQTMLRRAVQPSKQKQMLNLLNLIERCAEPDTDDADIGNALYQLEKRFTVAPATIKQYAQLFGVFSYLGWLHYIARRTGAEVKLPPAASEKVQQLRVVTAIREINQRANHV